MFLVDGSEKKAKKDEEKYGGDWGALWDTCADWFEVFPLTVKGQANLSVRKEGVCPPDDRWMEV